MDFLFDPVVAAGVDNRDNKGSIYGNVSAKNIVSYKNGNVTGTDAIKNYLGRGVGMQGGLYKFGTNDTLKDTNPYLQLIQDFSGPKMRALQLRYGDFAYLKDLGVYPINRLVILRRYAEGIIVPDNLNVWKNPARPIATVVGWVDGGADELFNFSFNERWETQNQMIHEIIGDILNKEFGAGSKGGAGAKNLVSIPNWSQGFLFGLMNKMGLTNDFGMNSIPFGDPNVLREAPYRDGMKYGLESSFNITLKTAYEQKIIGNIDAGMAMMDNINNLIKMGTSDVKYILAKNNKWVQMIMAAASAPSAQQGNAWLEFIKEIVDAFLGSINDLVSSIKSLVTSEDDRKKAAEDAKNALSSENLTKTINDVVKSVLTSTIGKYRWALKGSIGLMAGINTTPWHLTIGNPYSPAISMSNIIVEKVNLKFNNELAYNDMPTSMNVEIICKQGRNLGGQEIYRSFNNQYVRIYAAPSSSGTTTVATNSNKSADANNATVRTNDTITRDNQPDVQVNSQGQRTQTKEVPADTSNMVRGTSGYDQEALEDAMLGINNVPL